MQWVFFFQSSQELIRLYIHIFIDALMTIIRVTDINISSLVTFITDPHTNALQIHSPDYSTEVGRLAAHHWVGIMHEVRRSSEDIGLTCKDMS